MSGHFPAIPVDKIGPGPKVRAERLDNDHVTRMVEVVDALPPITVRLVAGRHQLVDGEHRLAAHKRAGRPVISVEVITATDAEAREIAITANRAHGLPMTRSELRSVLVLDGAQHELAKLAGPDGVAVLRAVAQRDLAPATTAVNRCRLMLRLADHIEAETRRLGRDVTVGEVLHMERAA